MPITASLLKVQIRGILLGQNVEVVQWYAPTGAAFITATAAGVAEAFWNDIKTDWRACHFDNASDKTTSVVVAEPGDTGAFGEWAIDPSEQEGTRDSGVGFQAMPPYCVVAVRQTVATRATRPGQKRFWGLGEGDSVNGILQPTLQGLVDTLMAHFESAVILGAPVATGVMTPQVVGLDPATGLPARQQDVIGHVTSVYVGTQVSRKYNRGT